MFSEEFFQLIRRHWEEMESSEPDSLHRLPSSSSSERLCASGRGIVTPRCTSASPCLFAAVVSTVSRVFARRRTWLRVVCLCVLQSLSVSAMLWSWMWSGFTLRWRLMPGSRVRPLTLLVLIHTRSLPGCGRLTPPSVMTQECPVMLAVLGW